MKYSISKIRNIRRWCKIQVPTWPHDDRPRCTQVTEHLWQNWGSFALCLPSSLNSYRSIRVALQVLSKMQSNQSLSGGNTAQSTTSSSSGLLRNDELNSYGTSQDQQRKYPRENLSKVRWLKTNLCKWHVIESAFPGPPSVCIQNQACRVRKWLSLRNKSDQVSAFMMCTYV